MFILKYFFNISHPPGLNVNWNRDILHLMHTPFEQSMILNKNKSLPEGEPGRAPGMLHTLPG